MFLSSVSGRVMPKYNQTATLGYYWLLIVSSNLRLSPTCDERTKQICEFATRSVAVKCFECLFVLSHSVVINVFFTNHRKRIILLSNFNKQEIAKWEQINLQNLYFDQ